MRGGTIMLSIENHGAWSTNRLRWIARIWSTVIIAVTLLVGVGYAWNCVTTGKADPHAAEDYPPIENVPPLFSFLSAVGLAVAWRREGLGAAIALVFSLATFPVLLIHWPITRDFPRYLVAPYGTWMLITIPGALFLICRWRSMQEGYP
jgi:hypothetical protein